MSAWPKAVRCCCCRYTLQGCAPEGCTSRPPLSCGMCPARASAPIAVPCVLEQQHWNTIGLLLYILNGIGALLPPLVQDTCRPSFQSAPLKCRLLGGEEPALVLNPQARASHAGCPAV